MEPKSRYIVVEFRGPLRNHMILRKWLLLYQEFLMYLASSRASSLQISFTGGAGFYGYFYGLFYVFTDVDQFHGFLIGSFTNMEYSHILCVF